jgi:hypothetical protein
VREAMELAHAPKIASDSLNEFARVMRAGANRSFGGRSDGGRLNLDQQNVRNGLGQLVLTLVKLLHELLERQAIRRMEAGSLTDSEIERLGVTLMLQAREIERLRREFGLEEDDLNLDLGPLGKLL